MLKSDRSSKLKERKLAILGVAIFMKSHCK